MRQFSAALAASVLLLGSPSLFAQDEVAAPAATAAASPELFTDADKDAAAIEKGIAALGKLRDAYRAAPAITEVITIQVQGAMGDQTQKLSSSYGTDSFKIDVDGQALLIGTGGAVMMSAEGMGDAYMAAEIGDGTAADAIARVTGGSGLPDLVIPMRLGKKDIPNAELPSLFALGPLQDLTLKGFRQSETGVQFLLGGTVGTAVVSSSTKSGLVDRIDLAMTPPGAPPEFKIDAAFVIDAKVLKALPEEITFDPAGRTRQEAPGLPVKVGDKAPQFTLETLGGESVSLADLKGQVVVIDFWATWCGPCKRGLPVLNEVAKWAKEEGLPVRFFGCNMGEQGDKAARLATAKGYWDGQNFAFESLLDADDAVAAKYGVTSIPTSFVIGPDGTILEVHQGFDPSMAESMKEELRKAASTKG
jgi:thiol-disulfide isomerase/thioredoxin